MDTAIQTPATATGSRIGRLGLILPTFPQESPLTPSATALASLSRAAERAGAGALWACDHLYWHRPSLECLSALAAIAPSTRQAVVGTCVLQLPLRAPRVVAKQAATIQQLSEGRFVLGVGVGSHAGEYEAAGVPFGPRGRVLDEAIAEVRAAWEAAPGAGTDQAPAHTPSPPAGPAPGARTPVREAYLQLPVPAPIPIWVGGSSAGALARAAQVGDGWVPLFLPPEAYARAVSDLARLADAAGRDPGCITRAVVAFVSVGEAARATERGLGWMSSLYGLPAKAFARHLLAGPAAYCADQVSRWYQAGAEHVVVYVTADDPLAQFEDLAGELEAMKGTRLAQVATGEVVATGAL